MVALLFLAACEAQVDVRGTEEARSRPLTRTDQFQGVAANGDGIVVVGDRGTVISSVDAGVSWTRRELRQPGTVVTPALIDVVACPDGRFVALDLRRRVWVSPGIGEDWTAHDFDVREEPMAITCDPRGRIWVVGSYATILASSDGGESWSDYSLGDDLILTTVQFLDDANGVISGEFGTFVTTSDGGETWELGAPIPNEFYPHAALFESVGQGWVAGLKGVVLRTADGGRSWSRQETETEMPIYRLVSGGGETFAVGGFGTVLRLDQGRWTAEGLPRASFWYLRDILPLGPNRLLVVGGGTARVLDLAPREGGDGGNGEAGSPAGGPGGSP